MGCGWKRAAAAEHLSQHNRGGKRPGLDGIRANSIHIRLLCHQPGKEPRHLLTNAEATAYLRLFLGGGGCVLVAKKGVARRVVDSEVKWIRATLDPALARSCNFYHGTCHSPGLQRNHWFAEWYSFEGVNELRSREFWEDCKVVRLSPWLCPYHAIYCHGKNIRTTSLSIKVNSIEREF